MLGKTGPMTGPMSDPSGPPEFEEMFGIDRFPPLTMPFRALSSSDPPVWASPPR